MVVKKYVRRGKKRDYGIRPLRKYFKIVTNGEVTEPVYFGSLKKFLPKGCLSIDTKSVRKSPMKVVEYALRLKKQFESDKTSLEYEIWVVFDKDEFSYDNAIRVAQENGIKVAYSNECFELWLLLHFQDVTGSLDRGSCSSKLREHLNKGVPGKFKYGKDKVSAEKAVKVISDRGDQQKAIQRAIALEAQHAISNSQIPWNENPSTSIHILVQKLLDLIPKEQ